MTRQSYPYLTRPTGGTEHWIPALHELLQRRPELTDIAIIVPQEVWAA